MSSQPKGGERHTGAGTCGLVACAVLSAVADSLALCTDTAIQQRCRTGQEQQAARRRELRSTTSMCGALEGTLPRPREQSMACTSVGGLLGLGWRLCGGAGAASRVLTQLPVPRLHACRPGHAAAAACAPRHAQKMQLHRCCRLRAHNQKASRSPRCRSNRNLHPAAAPPPPGGRLT